MVILPPECDGIWWSRIESSVFQRNVRFSDGEILRKKSCLGYMAGFQKCMKAYFTHTALICASILNIGDLKQTQLWYQLKSWLYHKIFFRNYPNALIFLPSLRAPVLLFSITREGSVEFQIETWIICSHCSRPHTTFNFNPLYCCFAEHIL